MARYAIFCYSRLMRTRNISLPDTLDDYVETLVGTGNYGSASEVIREGLRLLQERTMALHRLRSEVQEGLAELDRGEGDSLENVAARFRKRRTQTKKKR